MAKSKPKSVRKGLIHIEVEINGKNTRAIVSRGPTHNFLSVEEAKTLGLKPNKERVCLKPAHSREKPVVGLARAVELHMGDWKGKVDLTLATMDDFQVVLGIDFLRQVKDSKPHMNSLCIIEEKTRHLHASSGTRDQEDQGHAISHKAKKGFQKKCPH